MPLLEAFQWLCVCMPFCSDNKPPTNWTDFCSARGKKEESYRFPFDNLLSCASISSQVGSASNRHNTGIMCNESMSLVMSCHVLSCGRAQSLKVPRPKPHFGSFWQGSMAVAPQLSPKTTVCVRVITLVNVHLNFAWLGYVGIRVWSELAWTSWHGQAMLPSKLLNTKHHAMHRGPAVHSYPPPSQPQSACGLGGSNIPRWWPTWGLP